MAHAASSASPPVAASSSPPPPPPAALPEELIEEILLRFPPGEPASLLRAALVCKRWRRLVSGPGFRRRFAEFHRTPPMLGMFCSRIGCRRVYRHFVPATAFRPRHAERARKHVLDARHGRVLLRTGRRALLVWDPITGEERKVPLPRCPPHHAELLSSTAAVLCSSAVAGGCDHRDCHRGPFLVVVVRTVLGIGGVVETSIFTYSSDAAAWSEPICGQGPGRILVNPQMRSVVVGNALYFAMANERTALKYNMQLRQMSWIQLPASPFIRWQIMLTTTEDGGLGIAIEHESKLYIWSRTEADEVDATWEQSRVIELNVLLPVDADFTSLFVIGSTDDLGTIFMRAGDVVYALDLKNNTGKKVCEGEINSIVPYMSFYTPVVLEADGIGEGPSAGGSSASKA